MKLVAKILSYIKTKIKTIYPKLFDEQKYQLKNKNIPEINIVQYFLYKYFHKMYLF